MIKSQQSEEENEGFFKPEEKVVKIEQRDLEQFEANEGEESARELGEFQRPWDFKARIIDRFVKLSHYPEQLMNDQCQQEEEQIGQRVISQKISQKYLTLEEKYLNTTKFKMVYSKIPDNEFNNYIFCLNYLIDFSEKHYFAAQTEAESQSFAEKQNCSKDLPPIEQTRSHSFSFIFDSNFESGNLLYAFQDLTQTSIPTFDLIIQNDTNTRGYNQWFYFSIQNVNTISQTNDLNSPNSQQKKPKTIKIRIVNFIKKHLMFEDGVKPVAFFQSEKEWKFIGRQVQYKKSYIKRNIQFKGSNVTKNFYTLSFLLDFPQNIDSQKDKVYVALNYPYPYKRVISFIDSLISSNTSESISIQKQTLCHTISNNQVPYLVITSKLTEKQIEATQKVNRIKKQKQMQKYKEKEKLLKDFPETQIFPFMNNQEELTQDQIKKQILSKRKKILLLARQHPGESVGSFVLEGFLKQLMNGVNGTEKQQKVEPQIQKLQSTLNQPSESSQKLLRQYSIYVFPIINVDGVIYGNFRTNLAGFDLNRQWIEPNKWLHPEIYHLKKFIATLKNIEFVLDFHGHSRKLNSFIYACNNPVPILLQNQDENNYPTISMFRLYPYIFSKETELFSIKDCTYTISRDKIKTARINTFKNLNFNPYIFTLQTGFYGYSKQDKKFRYKINDFYTIGKAALQSLKTVLLKPKKSKDILKDVQNKSYLFDMWAYQNKQDPGSESNPSEDELNPIEIKTKVLASDKLKERQKAKNEILRRSERKCKNNQSLKQRKKRFHRKVETELKSQRKLVEVDRTSILLVSEKIQIEKEKVSRKEVKSQNEKGKEMRVQYYPEKKRNIMNSELFNVVALKQGKVQKPEFQLALPENQQKVNRTQRKVHHQDFKTTSNLLGGAINYYQNKVHRTFQPTSKTNPPTLQMLEINNLKKDHRIQSSVQVPFHEDSKMRMGENFLSRENKIKDLFFSLHRQEEKSRFSKRQEKSRFSRQSQEQRIFVVRENKIVKVVSNVNKIKSHSTIMEGDLNVRHMNLKKCQDKMSLDDRTLIEEIREHEEKVRKKKVFLNPIQY